MFNGEIIFDIADIRNIEIDFESEIMPTKIVNRGDVVALGRKAPKNRWIYKIEYSDETEYLEGLCQMARKLSKKAEYVKKLTRIYEEVSINIYVRSEYAEIGYSIPSDILKELSLLDCPIIFKILSFGMAITN